MPPKKPLDLMRIFAWSATGMMALGFVVDTGPVICAVDPTCRPMTPDEITMARPIFGNTIQYDSVRIFKRPTIFRVFNKDILAETLHSNIYLSAQMRAHRTDYGYALHSPYGEIGKQEDMAGIFIHELTHVWQHQNFGALYYGQPPEYSYEWAPDKKFTNYNREQQAEIVRDYFEMRRAFTFSAEKNDATMRQSFCQKLGTYEEKLKPHMPVQPHAMCQPDLH